MFLFRPSKERPVFSLNVSVPSSMGPPRNYYAVKSNYRIRPALSGLMIGQKWCWASISNMCLWHDTGQRLQFVCLPGVIAYSFAIFIITLPALIYWQLTSSIVRGNLLQSSSNFLSSSPGTTLFISSSSFDTHAFYVMEVILCVPSTFSSSWSNIFTMTSHLHGSSSHRLQRIY